MMTNPKSHLVLLALGCGCGAAVPPATDPAPIGTDTDGIFTSGIDGGDGVDETAEAPTPAYCITNHDNPESFGGIKHQCDVEYDFTVSFSISRPAPFSDVLPDIGHTNTISSLNDSTYAHPLVAACCTNITDDPGWPLEDTCNTIHHRVCLLDLVENVCNGSTGWLRSIGAATSVDQGGFLIQNVADDFENGTTMITGPDDVERILRDECIRHFFFGSDQLNAADLCDSEFSGRFHHTPWEPGLSWNQLGYSLFDLRLELSSSNDGPEIPPTPADSCELPPDNNGETPPFSQPGAGGGTVTPVGSIEVSVLGPEYGEESIEGLGHLGEDSRMHREITPSDELIIDRWVMTEKASTTVGTSSASVTLDGFELALVGERRAPIEGSTWTVPAGSAVFSLQASTGGVGYGVATVNATDIVFHSIAGGVDGCPSNVNTSCLVSGSFDIDHVDTMAGQWTLTVQETTWKP